MARGKGASSSRDPKAKRQRLKRKADMDQADKLGSTVQPKRQRVSSVQAARLRQAAKGHTEGQRVQLRQSKTPE